MSRLFANNSAHIPNVVLEPSVFLVAEFEIYSAPFILFTRKIIANIFDSGKSELLVRAVTAIESDTGFINT